MPDCSYPITGRGLPEKLPNTISFEEATTHLTLNPTHPQPVSYDPPLRPSVIPKNEAQALGYLQMWFLLVASLFVDGCCYRGARERS